MVLLAFQMIILINALKGKWFINFHNSGKKGNTTEDGLDGWQVTQTRKIN